MIETEEQKIEALNFYKEALDDLNESGVSFMLGGAAALFHHTGIYRDTKDLDVFCRPNDYPRILKFFGDKGFKTELTDVRWLGKIFKGEYYIDVIYDTVNNICTVDDTWFAHASQGEFAERPVLFLPVEDLIWCKIYVQNRERFDGADVNHLLLTNGKKLNWERLLNRLNPHWHLLLAQIVMFQFVYPSDYMEAIPRWVFDELMERARAQYDLPSTIAQICRGPIIDQTQYAIDIKEWNYKVNTMRSV